MKIPINKITWNNKKTRLIKCNFSFFCLLFIFLTIPTLNVYAEDLEQKISEIENLKSQNQSQQKNLSAELSSLDSTISSIQASISSTQQQIDNTNAKIDNTNANIEKTEKDIAKEKGILGKYIRQMYVDGQISEIQLILTSNNFSDFVDKAQYLLTMQTKIQSTVDQITKLKDGLESQKKALEIEKSNTEQLKSTQVSQQQSISAQISAKNYLLQKTKGDDAIYQSMLASLYKERAEKWGGGAIGTDSSYVSYMAKKAGSIDQWNFYKFQCTSYAAFMAVQNNIISPSDLRYLSSTHGNGGEWANGLMSRGYLVDKNPTANSIVSWPIGTFTTESYYDAYGHVAYVAGVNADGTMTIKEYNFTQPISYDVRTNVPLGNGYIIHAK